MPLRYGSDGPCKPWRKRPAADLLAYTAYTSFSTLIGLSCICPKDDTTFGAENDGHRTQVALCFQQIKADDTPFAGVRLLDRVVKSPFKVRCMGTYGS
jgi:hypothetical protein